MATSAENMLSVEEAVRLAATDSIFYSHYFFPHVVRQDSAPFHRDMWNLLETPDTRYINFQIFRGGAKTTLARLFLSKRIAYGISRTVLFIGKSEGHAANSVGWLMQQVEYNTEWAQAFGLKKGKKWTLTDCEIIHTAFGHTIRIIALGITGSVRGINIEGYRPDLIIVDDPCDEENTATPEQRHKIERLFFGAVMRSLVPASEDPSAKLLLTQTPLDEEDLSNQCVKSEEFRSFRIGCFDSEDIEHANSTWPTRWSKEELLKGYRAAEAMNQLSIWWAEMMCIIVARELSAFKEEWLEYWEVLPITARYVAAIDPAPVLSDKARATGQKTDLQAIMVKAYWQSHRYVVEYKAARDEAPDEVSKALDLYARKYPLLRCGVEDVAYQRTLKWYLETEMRAGRCKSIHVLPIPTLAKDKYSRIIQAHAGPASQGLLHVHRTHTEFTSQFTRFPNVKYKDLLDVSAICDATVSPGALSAGYSDVIDLDESQYEELKWERPCP